MAENIEDMLLVGLVMAVAYLGVRFVLTRMMPNVWATILAGVAVIAFAGAMGGEDGLVLGAPAPILLTIVFLARAPSYDDRRREDEEPLNASSEGSTMAERARKVHQREGNDDEDEEYLAQVEERLGKRLRRRK